MQLRLNGPSELRQGSMAGEEGAPLAGVPELMQPTRERWQGPVDLDAAAAARAEELNRTWVESGGGGRLLLHAPLSMRLLPEPIEVVFSMHG